MDTLFTPIVAALENLSDVGFRWSKNAVDFNTKVYMCPLSVDSVAHAPLRDIKQFNREYGCAWCLNPGNMINKSLGQVCVYIEKSGENHCERTHASTVDHAEQSLKGPSLLLLVHHSTLFAGSFLTICILFYWEWLDSTSHNEPHPLGQHVSQIDVIVVGIKLPSEVKRLPRSIGLRKYWKAAEFRNFLLLYTPVA